MEKACVHQANALSLTAPVRNVRYELLITKPQDAGLNKLLALKANDSRAITIHNIAN